MTSAVVYVGGRLGRLFQDISLTSASHKFASVEAELETLKDSQRLLILVIRMSTIYRDSATWSCEKITNCGIGYLTKSTRTRAPKSLETDILHYLKICAFADACAELHAALPTALFASDPFSVRRIST